MLANLILEVLNRALVQLRMVERNNGPLVRLRGNDGQTRCRGL